MKNIICIAALAAMLCVPTLAQAKITPPPGSKVFTLAPDAPLTYFSSDGNSTSREASYFNAPELIGKRVYGIEVYGLLQDGKSLQELDAVYNQAIFYTPGKVASNREEREFLYGTIRNDGVMYVTFNNGFIVPDSGFFAGWWFDTDEDYHRLFVASSEGKGTAGGLWVEHSPYPFKDLSNVYGPAPIKLYYCDDKPAVTGDISVNQVTDMYVAIDQPSSVPVSITNDSWAAVTNYTYTVKVDGELIETTTVDRSSWKDENFSSGLSEQVDIALPGLDEGEHEVVVTVTKASGMSNVSANKRMTFNVIAVDGKVIIPAGCIKASLMDNRPNLLLKTGLSNIEACTRYHDPLFKGLKVVGFEVKGLPETGLSNIKVWYRNAKDGKNIETQDALQSGDCAGALFKKPVEITDDGPFFGVSYDVNNADLGSIPVAGKKDVRDGCWGMGRNGWTDFSEYGTLMLTLFVEGENIPDNSVKVIDNYGKKIFQAGQGYSAMFHVINTGKLPVTNLGYSFNTNEIQDNGSATLGQPLEVIYGAPQSITVDMPAVDHVCDLKGTMSFPIVNGEENNYASDSAAINFRMVSRVGTKRPLFEEYTGTGCGWCPRGFVAMKIMGEKYPDFIPAVYHLYYTDPMTPEDVTLPWSCRSAPGATIDRTSNIDPFYGTSDGRNMGIEDDYIEALYNVPAANIEIKTTWDETTKTIKVHSATLFAFLEENESYKLGYILTANKCSGEGSDWVQSNTYRGNDKYADNPYLKGLYNGTYDLSVYHDIVLTGSIPKGTKATALKDVQESYMYGDTISFSIKGNDLVAGPQDVSVIALLMNSDGHVVNARRVQAGESTADINYPEPGTPQFVGVEATVADRTTQTVYYDLMGRMVKPTKGLYIKVQNGKATKVKI